MQYVYFLTKKKTLIEFISMVLIDIKGEGRSNMSENLEQNNISNFNELLHNLITKGDEDVRSYTVEALGTIKNEMAVSDLIDCLSDRNERIRIKVAEILGDINEKSAALDLAKKGLHDDKDLVRWMSAWALGKLRAEETTDAIMSALDDENPWVRGTSAWALGRIGDKKSIDKLEKLTNDKNSWVRIQSVRALGMISDKRSTLDVLNALTDKNKLVRSSAAWSLGMIGDNRAIGDLKDIIRSDEHKEVKENSIWALGSIGEHETADFLIDIILNNDEFEIRKEASKSLSEILSDSIPDVFKKKLDSGLIKTRIRILEFLGFFGGDESIDYLKSYLYDSNPELRFTAIKSLGELSSKTALKPLTKIVQDDENFSIRETAVEALGKMDKEISKKSLRKLKDDLENEKLKGLINDILEGKSSSEI